LGEQFGAAGGVAASPLDLSERDRPAIGTQGSPQSARRAELVVARNRARIPALPTTAAASAPGS